MKHLPPGFVFAAALFVACSPAGAPIDDGTGATTASASSSDASASIDARLSIPFTVGSSDGMYDVNVLTGDGVRHVVSYDERLPEGNLAQAYVMSPDGTIYLAGIGAEGFSVYDTAGVERTGEYGWLKDKPFGITDMYRLDDRLVAYGIHGADAGTGGYRVAGIHVRDTRDGTERVLPMAQVGLDRLEGLQPLCLSADGASLYVRYQGWEGFTYSSVWRLRLADMRIENVITRDDKIVDYHCSDRRDFLVGVRAEGTTDGAVYQEASPPSQLVLFDLATGSRSTLFSSDHALVGDAFFTPDAKRIVFSVTTPAASHDEYESPYSASGAVREYFSVAPDGTDRRSLGTFEVLAGMSYDGSTLIVGTRVPRPYADSMVYSALDAATGELEPLTDDGYGDPIRCNYGQGFDCWYPRR